MPVPHVVRPATAAAPKMQHQGGKDVTRARHRPPWSTAATHTTGPRIPDQHGLLDRRAWPPSQALHILGCGSRQLHAALQREARGRRNGHLAGPTPSARRHPARHLGWQEDKGSVGGRGLLRSEASGPQMPHLSVCSLVPTRLPSRHPSVRQQEPHGLCSEATSGRLRQNKTSLRPSLNSGLARQALLVGPTHLCMSSWPVPHGRTRRRAAACLHAGRKHNRTSLFPPCCALRTMHWDHEKSKEEKSAMKKIALLAALSLDNAAD